MYRKILIALIIIVLLILGGLIAFSNGDGNEISDTRINFLDNKTLKNGDSIEFELTDIKGNSLPDQDLKITFAPGEGEVQNFTITTDSQGKGALVVNDQADGNYTVTVTYAGSEKYNGCSANKTFTIGEGNATYTDSTYAQSQSGGQSSGSSSSSSDMSYDSDLNVNYDSNGIVHGGQNDGARIEDVRTSQRVDSDGNLV